MCASYWNLWATIRCPKCGHVSRQDLQTHFEGGGGTTMCTDYYEIGDTVPDLGGMTITLDGSNDSFIAGCPSCNEYMDWGAEIVNGKVVNVWPIGDDPFCSLGRRSSEGGWTGCMKLSRTRRTARDKLVEEIQTIEVQLLERKARAEHPSATDAEYDDYQAWRAKAQGAKTHKTALLRKTKQWIRDHRSDRMRSRIARRGGEDGLLSDLYALVKALISAGADISVEEQQLVDDIGAHLQTKGKV